MGENFRLKPFDENSDFAMWKVKMKAILIKEKCYKAVSKEWPIGITNSEMKDIQELAHSEIMIRLTDDVARQVFIVLRRDIWGLVLEDMKSVDQLLMEVNTIVSPCARAAWMKVPIMGLVFATLYQVALVCLTWFGPCTCLPLWAPLGSEPPTTVYAIALVRNRDHFVPIWLLDDQCPIPPPSRQWSTYKDPSVDGWDTHPRFKSRFEFYVSSRRLLGRPDIIT